MLILIWLACWWYMSTLCSFSTAVITSFPHFICLLSMYFSYLMRPIFCYSKGLLLERGYWNTIVCIQNLCNNDSGSFHLSLYTSIQFLRHIKDPRCGELFFTFLKYPIFLFLSYQFCLLSSNFLSFAFSYLHHEVLMQSPYTIHFLTWTKFHWNL